MDYYDGSSSGSTPILSQSLKDEVLKTDHVENATFFYSRTDYNSSVYYENSSFSGGKVYGIDTNYLKTCGYQVRSGRGFVQADYDNFRKVALVDSYAADTMFPGANPVGKIIEIGSEPYTVVGVVRQSADSLPNMDTPSDFNSYYENVIGTVMIPNKCWPISYKFDEPENAIVKVDSTDNMSETGSAVAKILNKSISSTGSGSSGFKYKADDVMQRVKDLQDLSESTNSQLIKYFSSGWRYWCYEYHAGICNRAYQGDWSEEGNWCQKEGDSGTVPDGGSSTYQCWRYYRSCSWNRTFKSSIQGGRLTYSHQRSGDYRLCSILYADRYHLWSASFC